MNTAGGNKVHTRKKPISEAKRILQNDQEKQRKEKIKTCIHDIAKELPQNNVNRKQSTLSIVSEAKEYIRKLKEQNQAFENNSSAEQQQEELKQLRELQVEHLEKITELERAVRAYAIEKLLKLKSSGGAAKADKGSRDGRRRPETVSKLLDKGRNSHPQVTHSLSQSLDGSLALLGSNPGHYQQHSSSGNSLPPSSFVLATPSSSVTVVTVAPTVLSVKGPSLSQAQNQQIGCLVNAASVVGSSTSSQINSSKSPLCVSFQDTAGCGFNSDASCDGAPRKDGAQTSTVFSTSLVSSSSLVPLCGSGSVVGVGGDGCSQHLKSAVSVRDEGGISINNGDVADGNIHKPDLCPALLQQQQGMTPVLSLGQQQGITPALSLGQQQGITPALSLGQQQGMTPVLSLGRQQGITPALGLGQQQGITPALGLGQQQGITPVLNLGQQQGITPVLNLGQQQGITPALNLGQQQGITPVLNLGQQQGITPVLSLGQQQGITPVLNLGLQQGITPVLNLGQQQGITPVLNLGQQQGITPVLSLGQLQGGPGSASAYQTQASSVTSHVAESLQGGTSGNVKLPVNLGIGSLMASLAQLQQDQQPLITSSIEPKQVYKQASFGGQIFAISGQSVIGNQHHHDADIPVTLQVNNMRTQSNGTLESGTCLQQSIVSGGGLANQSLLAGGCLGSAQVVATGSGQPLIICTISDQGQLVPVQGQLWPVQPSLSGLEFVAGTGGNMTSKYPDSLTGSSAAIPSQVQQQQSQQNVFTQSSFVSMSGEREASQPVATVLLANPLPAQVVSGRPLLVSQQLPQQQVFNVTSSRGVESGNLFSGVASNSLGAALSRATVRVIGNELKLIQPGINSLGARGPSHVIVDGSLVPVSTDSQMFVPVISSLSTAGQNVQTTAVISNPISQVLFSGGTPGIQNGTQILGSGRLFSPVFSLASNVLSGTSNILSVTLNGSVGSSSILQTGSNSGLVVTSNLAAGTTTTNSLSACISSLSASKTSKGGESHAAVAAVISKPGPTPCSAVNRCYKYYPPSELSSQQCLINEQEVVAAVKLNMPSVVILESTRGQEQPPPVAKTSSVVVSKCSAGSVQRKQNLLTTVAPVRPLLASGNDEMWVCNSSSIQHQPLQQQQKKKTVSGIAEETVIPSQTVATAGFLMSGRSSNTEFSQRADITVQSGNIDYSQQSDIVGENRNTDCLQRESSTDSVNTDCSQEVNISGHDRNTDCSQNTDATVESRSLSILAESNMIVSGSGSKTGLKQSSCNDDDGDHLIIDENFVSGAKSVPLTRSSCSPRTVPRSTLSEKVSSPESTQVSSPGSAPSEMASLSVLDHSTSQRLSSQVPCSQTSKRDLPTSLGTKIPFAATRPQNKAQSTNDTVNGMPQSPSAGPLSSSSSFTPWIHNSSSHSEIQIVAGPFSPDSVIMQVSNSISLNDHENIVPNTGVTALSSSPSHPCLTSTSAFCTSYTPVAPSSVKVSSALSQCVPTSSSDVVDVFAVPKKQSMRDRNCSEKLFPVKATSSSTQSGKVNTSVATSPIVGSKSQNNELSKKRKTEAEVKNSKEEKNTAKEEKKRTEEQELRKKEQKMRVKEMDSIVASDIQGNTIPVTEVTDRQVIQKQVLPSVIGSKMLNTDGGQMSLMDVVNRIEMFSSTTVTDHMFCGKSLGSDVGVEVEKNRHLFTEVSCEDKAVKSAEPESLWNKDQNLERKFSVKSKSSENQVTVQSSCLNVISGGNFSSSSICDCVERHDVNAGHFTQPSFAPVKSVSHVMSGCRERNDDNSPARDTAARFSIKFLSETKSDARTDSSLQSNQPPSPFDYAALGKFSYAPATSKTVSLPNNIMPMATSSLLSLPSASEPTAFAAAPTVSFPSSVTSAASSITCGAITVDSNNTSLSMSKKDGSETGLLSNLDESFPIEFSVLDFQISPKLTEPHDDRSNSLGLPAETLANFLHQQNPENSNSSAVLNRIIFPADVNLATLPAPALSTNKGLCESLCLLDVPASKEMISSVTPNKYSLSHVQDSLPSDSSVGSAAVSLSSSSAAAAGSVTNSVFSVLSLSAPVSLSGKTAGVCKNFPDVHYHNIVSSSSQFPSFSSTSLDAFSDILPLKPITAELERGITCSSCTQRPQISAQDQPDSHVTLNNGLRPAASHPSPKPQSPQSSGLSAGLAQSPGSHCQKQQKHSHMGNSFMMEQVIVPPLSHTPKQASSFPPFFPVPDISLPSASFMTPPSGLRTKIMDSSTVQSNCERNINFSGSQNGAGFSHGSVRRQKNQYSVEKIMEHSSNMNTSGASQHVSDSFNFTSIGSNVTSTATHGSGSLTSEFSGFSFRLDSSSSQQSSSSCAANITTSTGSVLPMQLPLPSSGMQISHNSSYLNPFFPPPPAINLSSSSSSASYNHSSSMHSLKNMEIQHPVSQSSSKGSSAPVCDIGPLGLMTFGYQPSLAVLPSISKTPSHSVGSFSCVNNSSSRVNSADSSKSSARAVPSVGGGYGHTSEPGMDIKNSKCHTPKSEAESVHQHQKRPATAEHSAGDISHMGAISRSHLSPHSNNFFSVGFSAASVTSLSSASMPLRHLPDTRDIPGQSSYDYSVVPPHPVIGLPPPELHSGYGTHPSFAHECTRLESYHPRKHIASKKSLSFSTSAGSSNTGISDGISNSLGSNSSSSCRSGSNISFNASSVSAVEPILGSSLVTHGNRTTPTQHLIGQQQNSVSDSPACHSRGGSSAQKRKTTSSSSSSSKKKITSQLAGFPVDTADNTVSQNTHDHSFPYLNFPTLAQSLSPTSNPHQSDTSFLAGIFNTQARSNSSTKTSDMTASHFPLFPTRPQSSFFQSPGFGVNTVTGSHVTSTSGISPHSVGMPASVSAFGLFGNEAVGTSESVAASKFLHTNSIIPGNPHQTLDQQGGHHQTPVTPYHSRPHSSQPHMMAAFYPRGFDSRSHISQAFNSPIGPPPFHTPGLPPINFSVHEAH